MIYLQLLWSFVQIGLFSFGGGYSSIPLIQEQIVETNHWLTLNEFADIVTISQMTPGPVAINAATFVGVRVAGPLGSIVATIGCILPSCIIVSILGVVYLKLQRLSMVQGVLQTIRPAVVGLIASAALSLLLLSLIHTGAFLGLKSVDWLAAAIFLICFILLRALRWNPVLMILIAGAAGFFCYGLPQLL